MKAATLKTGAVVAFDEDEHAYTINGKPASGLSAFMRRRGYCDRPPAWVEKHLDRGRRVHAMIEYDAVGDLDESSIHEADAPYLVGWRKWRDEQRPEILGVEILVADEGAMLATQIDQVIRLRGEVWTVNVKSHGASGGTKLPHYRMQTAFELLLDGVATRRGILHVCADATAWLEEHDDASEVALAIAELNQARRARAWRMANGG